MKSKSCVRNLHRILLLFCFILLTCSCAPSQVEPPPTAAPSQLDQIEQPVTAAGFAATVETLYAIYSAVKKGYETVKDLFGEDEPSLEDLLKGTKSDIIDAIAEGIEVDLLGDSKTYIEKFEAFDYWKTNEGEVRDQVESGFDLVHDIEEIITHPRNEGHYKIAPTLAKTYNVIVPMLATWYEYHGLHYGPFKTTDFVDQIYQDAIVTNNKLLGWDHNYAESPEYATGTYINVQLGTLWMAQWIREGKPGLPEDTPDDFFEKLEEDLEDFFLGSEPTDHSAFLRIENKTRESDVYRAVQLANRELRKLCVGYRVLHNGSSVSGLSASEGEWLLYEITTDRFASNLIIETFGGTGNADLYVARTVADGRTLLYPSESIYDCHSTSSGNNEFCKFANPQTETQVNMMGIYARQDFSDLTISATYEGGKLTNGFPVCKLSASAGEWLKYWIRIPYWVENDSDEKLEVKLCGGSGDADIYVNRGFHTPAFSDYDCRSIGCGNNEYCSTKPVWDTLRPKSEANSVFYIFVYANDDFSDTELVVNLLSDDEDGSDGTNNQDRDCSAWAVDMAQPVCGESGDEDGDGVSDVCDNCLTALNGSQVDTDRDGLGDACDNCPQVDDLDQDDSDEDGSGDICDNCITTWNRDQADFDEDGYGDACDNCPRAANPDQSDCDDNGIGDACDWPTPQFTTAPSRLIFPIKGTGEKETKKLIISNEGVDPVRIASMTLKGLGDHQREYFSVDRSPLVACLNPPSCPPPPCGSTPEIEPGDACQIGVTFVNPNWGAGVEIPEAVLSINSNKENCAGHAAYLDVYMTASFE